MSCTSFFFFFFFKQKTAYEMRISDWSSDVCSSDLIILIVQRGRQRLDRSISKRTLESQLSEQTMRHNNLLVAGIGEAKGRAAPGRVRDREAAALAGGGGADLRSKLGEPPILDEIGRASGRDRVCQYV